MINCFKDFLLDEEEEKKEKTRKNPYDHPWEKSEARYQQKRSRWKPETSEKKRKAAQDFFNELKKKKDVNEAVNNDEYYYHGTEKKNIASIKQHGLRPSWAPLNFHKNENWATDYTKKNGHLLRVHKKHMPHDLKTQDITGHAWTSDIVKTKHIEIKHKDKWIPLKNHNVEENISVIVPSKETKEAALKYLTEQWKFINRRHPYKYLDYAKNEKQFGGDKVKVDFNHIGNGGYEIAYKVNNAWQKDLAGSARHPQKEPGNQYEILHHVHDKIHQFIDKLKPNYVMMSSHDPQKIALHDRLAKKLAKKYGGRVRKIELPGLVSTMHKVEFK
jgi:hypothetical protein